MYLEMSSLLSLFWLCITYHGLQVSSFQHSRSGIISFADGNPSNPPQQLNINNNYMLTNQPIQMPPTLPSIVQTPGTPQIVTANIVAVLDESLMIKYTSAPPIVSAPMAPGTVSQTNIVTVNSAQVDLVSSVLEVEQATSTVESVDLSVSTLREDNSTSTIGVKTTGGTGTSSTSTASTAASTSSVSVNLDTPQTTTLASTSSSPSTVTSGSTTIASSTATINSTNIPGINETETNAPQTTSLSSTGTLQPVTSAATAETSNSISPLMTILNSSVIGPIVGFVFPAEIRIYVNITSIPAISVNVTSLSPSTSDDTIEVDIFEGNNTAIVRNDYVESTSETVSGTTINIDLSNQNIDFGWPTFTTPLLPLSTNRPMTTTTSMTMPTITRAPVTNRIYEERCNQYYAIGTRRTRKVQVHVHIIGGTYTAQKEFPHMVALGYGRKAEPQWLCGGSLISEEYVITAAHCLSAETLGDIQYVRLGTTTLQTETLESEDHDVIARIPHPDYITGKQYNDIALLRLDRAVEFNEFIAPICLTASRDLTYTKLVATGWGKQESGGVSKELQKVELDYVPRDVCQRGYNGISLEELPDGIREESQLCAGSSQGAKDTCQGDSGGPLQLQQDGRMYLIGITSFGIGCGRPESPGVYTRVSHYIPWIESIVWRQ